MPPTPQAVLARAAAAAALALSSLAHAQPTNPVATIDITPRNPTPQLAGEQDLARRIADAFTLDRTRGSVVIASHAGAAPVVGIASQQFPDDPTFTCAVYDEFTTHDDWFVTELVLSGFENGNPACNQAVVGEIWSGRPGHTGVLVLQGSGTQIGSDLFISFGGQFLPAGSYLLSAYVIRPYDDGFCQGFQWYALATDQVDGREAGWLNPGGGWGHGTDIGNISDLVAPTGVPVDLIFQLTGFPSVFTDCNSNGILDATDILDRTSFDTNANGLPDECERASGDFDLDGEPDFLDAEPNVYSTFPGAPLSSVTVQQLSFPSTEYSQAASLTEHGAVTLSFPTEPERYLYVNIEINGVWAVQNQLSYTTDLREDFPTQSETYFINLGTPRGVAVSSAAVRWWVDPLGFDTLPPGTAPLFPVTLATYRVGGDGANFNAPFNVPIAPIGPLPAPAPMAAEVKTTVENETIEVADLKWSFEKSSCAPNSVGGSFEWLFRTYKITPPAGLATVDQLVLEFRILMDTLLGKGTTAAKRKEAKEGFIRKHMLPLTVESGNVGAANPADGLVTPQQILDEMKKGQDVEISYGKWVQDGPGMPPTWVRHGGHAVAIKSITKCEKDGVVTWKITFRHDWRQSESGGVDDVTVTLTEQNIDLDNDGTAETGWVLDNGPFAGAATRVIETFTAESPTISQMLIAIGLAQSDNAAARSAALADSMIDLAEAKNLLTLAEQRKKLWMRLLELAKAQMPPRTVIADAAARALKSVCNIRDTYAEMVKTLSGGGRSVLPEDDLDLIDYEESSVAGVDYPAAVAANPNDADLDDVDDGIDNAPGVPNPDQADQDNNLVPDVLELSPANDCDDNGIIDSYEVTLTDIVDYLPDGTPIFGFIYDLDANATPDPCESAPPVECTADLDDDFDVDVFDFGIFAIHFGDTGLNPGSFGDFDLDSDVDVFDFGIFAVQFGCPN